jgi:hypothetical protein
MIARKGHFPLTRKKKTESYGIQSFRNFQVK